VGVGWGRMEKFFDWALPRRMIGRGRIGRTRFKST